MAKALKVVDNISDWSGKIFAFFFFPGTFVLIYEIVSRYLFNAPTVWAHGISQRLFAVYFVIGAAYCVLHKSHIRVDVIYNRFSVRTQAIIDILVTTSLLLLVGLVLLWHGSDFFWTSASRLQNDTTPFGAPVYPIKFFIPVTGLLLLLQGLASLYRYVVTAVSGEGAA